MLRISDNPHTRTRILEYIEEKVGDRERPPTKHDIANALDVSERTIEKHQTTLERNDDITILDDSGVNRYAPFSYNEGRLDDYNQLEAEVMNAIEKLRAKLHREPRKEEVAIEIERDPEDRTFRRIFSAVASDIEWNKPNDSVVQNSREELFNLLKSAFVLRNGFAEDDAYPDSDREHSEYRLRVEEYLRENIDLVDELEIVEEKVGGEGVVKIPDYYAKFLLDDKFRIVLESTADSFTIE